MRDRFNAAMECRVAARTQLVCPHCKKLVSEFAFLSPDAQAIQTWQCVEHGDVVPMRSAIYNDDFRCYSE